MEHRTLYLALLGISVGLLWVVDFFHLFKKADLHLPKTNIQTNGLKSFLRMILFIMGVLSWIFISYSLTNPRRPLKYAPSSIEANDIFLVLDVSRSMLADDFEPNRLEVAKDKVKEFVNLKPTDRLGLIIFSEKAFTLLPLTTDTNLVAQTVSSIEIGGLGSGTNIGDALALAVARLANSEAKNKVVVLLTDGVNNVGNMTPIQAAEVAKEYNIKVYTIAMGSDHNARIPVNGGLFGTQYQIIPGGSIDTKTLDQISKMTNAKTFMASSTVALQNVFNEINQLEKTKINVTSQIVYEELYLNYLLIGVVLFIITEFLRKIALRDVL